MMKDKELQKIFDDSQKAEFMEAINEHLPKSYRAMVCFETRTEDGGGTKSEFQYCQIGFVQSYEVGGFLKHFSNMVEDDALDMEEE